MDPYFFISLEENFFVILGSDWLVSREVRTAPAKLKHPVFSNF